VIGAATAAQRFRAIRPPPNELPVYTVIVALYDEAVAVPALIRSLSRIEYPALGSKCTSRSGCDSARVAMSDKGQRTPSATGRTLNEKKI